MPLCQMQGTRVQCSACSTPWPRRFMAEAAGPISRPFASWIFYVHIVGGSADPRFGRFESPPLRPQATVR